MNNSENKPTSRAKHAKPTRRRPSAHGVTRVNARAALRQARVERAERARAGAHAAVDEAGLAGKESRVIQRDSSAVAAADTNNAAAQSANVQNSSTDSSGGLLDQALGPIAENMPKNTKPKHLAIGAVVLAVVLAMVLANRTGGFTVMKKAAEQVKEAVEERIEQAAPAASTHGAVQGFSDDVECWRSTVETACIDCGLDTKWVDTILAMMETETGGNVDTSSVTGAAHDIMQAAEGMAGVNAGAKDVIDYGAMGLVAWDITPSIGFDGNTCTASIYAGVIETKYNVELWEDWLGPINVDDASKVALIAQGYNYGADGWFRYCCNHGVTDWNIDSSLAYQYNMGGGTATHGQKVMGFYIDARQSAAV